MPRSRLVLYLVIALVIMALSYYNLAREPHPRWPINLIHLLARH